jgi:hypothetical protein
MKLIINTQTNKVGAVATDLWEPVFGNEVYVSVPNDFNLDIVQEYDYVNGELVLPKIDTILIANTQSRLDSFVQTRGYDNILSCVSYINSTNTIYKSDATYALEARDHTWQTLYHILNEIESNTSNTIITSFDQIANSLPVLAWPN